MARLGQAGAQSGREAAGNGGFISARSTPHGQKDDFFTSSTKLVNRATSLWAMIERRRQAFLDAAREPSSGTVL
jgi:hypothetical protein